MKSAKTRLQFRAASSNIKLTQCGALFVASALVVSVAHAQYSFTLLDVPAYGGNVARGASPGTQAGYGQEGTMYSSRALVWHGSVDSVVELDPGGVYLESRALCANGIYQGGWARQGAGGGGNEHAALWSGSAGTFSDLNPLGYYRSALEAIDGASGTQAGWAGSLVYYYDHAMIWRGDHDHFTDLHPTHLPEYGANSRILGAAGGVQVGYAERFGPVHAAMWTGSKDSFLDLHPAGAAYSIAYATDGKLKGGSATFGSTTHAYLWSGTGTTALDLHPSGVKGNSAISGMIEGTQVGDANGHAYLWHGTAASALDLHTFVPSEWTGSAAWAIGPDGTIVGAVGSGVRSAACMWTPDVAPPPPPAPPRFAAAGLAGGGTKIRLSAVVPAGVPYALETTTDLKSWTFLSEGVGTGTATVFEVLIDTTGPKHFFRLVLEE